MDPIAHTLWTYPVFMKNKYWKLALFFGVLPDIPLMMFIIYNLLMTGTINVNTPYVFYILQRILHSLIIILPVVLILFLIFKTKVLFLFALPLHIVIDIFTHSKYIFQHKPFFPFSDYSFNGINWFSPYFIVVNYLLLFVVYYFVYKNVKNRKNNKNIKKRI
ncbi:MAG: hypothetical protein V1663_01000 [archaeon]